jgi:hypothetical protein
MADSDYTLMVTRQTKDKEVLDPVILPEDAEKQYRMLPAETVLFRDEVRPIRRYNGFQIPTQKVYVRSDVRMDETAETVDEGYRVQYRKD